MKFEKLFQRRAIPQEVVVQETAPSPDEIVGLYEQAGQPPPGPVVLEGLLTGELKKEHLISHLRSLESAREAGRPISQVQLTELARYGIKNLSHIRINAEVPALELLNLEGCDLSESVLDNSTFNSVNFSNVCMDGVSVYNTHFYGSVLNTAEVPSIVLRGENLDMETKATTVATDDTWNLHKTDINPIDNCDDCEVFNRGVLGVDQDSDSSRYSRRGVLLFQEGKPLGVLKLKGENTFLAMRTVRNTEGEVILFKGMVYAFERDVIKRLNKQSLMYEGSDAWRRADTENMREEVTEYGYALTRLGRNNLRFIADPTIFRRLSALVDDIEAGQEPMVDIFDKRKGK